jgi:hypothetical protein
MKVLFVYAILSFTSVAGIGAIDGSVAFALAAVLIVLIVSLLILALRGIGPIFERGKTRFRLGPIREKPPRRR